MKKKEMILAVLKSLIGFPIGITILMVAYGSIYFICGQETFTNEINQLINIEVFIKQLLFSGIATSLLIIAVNILFGDLISKKNIKTIILSVLLSIVIIDLSMLILINDIFSKNIVYMNMAIFVVVSIPIMIYISIKAKINMNIINNKIKEINAN